MSWLRHLNEQACSQLTASSQFFAFCKWITHALFRLKCYWLILYLLCVLFSSFLSDNSSTGTCPWNIVWPACGSISWSFFTASHSSLHCQGSRTLVLYWFWCCSIPSTPWLRSNLTEFLHSLCLLSSQTPWRLHSWMATEWSDQMSRAFIIKNGVKL